MQGNLYLVSTPIGNLEDITFRAINTLKGVDVIFAESIERTKKLLSHYDIDKKVFSYNKDNESIKAQSIINYLKKNHNVALVTDAGTPSISDPGFFVQSNISKSTNVIPIPGASSLSCALSVSRIPINSFIFLGFLPKKSSDRKSKLISLYPNELPLVLFESKHRVIDLLNDVKEIYDNVTIGIFRELTKIHESIIHGNIDEIIDFFGNNAPKGEFVIIIGPGKNIESTNHYHEAITTLISKKLSNKDIVEVIKLFSTDSKKEIYKNVLSIRQE